MANNTTKHQIFVNKNHESPASSHLRNLSQQTCQHMSTTNGRSFTMFQGRVVLTRGQGLGPPTLVSMSGSLSYASCAPTFLIALRFLFTKFLSIHSIHSFVFFPFFSSKALSAFLVPLFSFFLRQYPHFLRLIAFLLANLLSSFTCPFHPFLFPSISIPCCYPLHALPLKNAFPVKPSDFLFQKTLSDAQGVLPLDFGLRT